jgi:hypothetical protein
MTWSRRELKREVEMLKEDPPAVGPECVAPAFVDTTDAGDVVETNPADADAPEIDSVFIANDPKE